MNTYAAYWYSVQCPGISISTQFVNILYSFLECSQMHSVNILHWSSYQCSGISANAHYQYFALEQFSVFWNFHKCTVSTFCTGTVFSGC